MGSSVWVLKSATESHQPFGYGSFVIPVLVVCRAGGESVESVRPGEITQSANLSAVRVERVELVENERLGEVP